MTITTYYISRVATVPPLVACAAYDDLAGDLPSVSITVDDGALVLDAASVRRPARGHRAVPGVLRSGGGRMTVTLELEAWSARRAQLGLRPHRWGPRAWPNRRQLAAGHAALGVLADELARWADEPLRALSAAQRDGIASCAEML